MSVLLAIQPAMPRPGIRASRWSPCAADGEKTLIRRSWEAAMAVAGVDRVVVATDDDRIRDHAQGFGAEVVMTTSDARNGTERCAGLRRCCRGLRWW